MAVFLEVIRQNAAYADDETPNPLPLRSVMGRKRGSRTAVSTGSEEDYQGYQSCG
jgi:hypothetical protein